MSKIRSEIVAFAELIRTLAASTLGVLEGFGLVHLTGAQIGQLLAWFATLSVVLSAVARAGVIPTAQVALTNDQAAALPKPTSVYIVGGGGGGATGGGSAVVTVVPGGGGGSTPSGGAGGGYGSAATIPPVPADAVRA